MTDSDIDETIRKVVKAVLGVRLAPSENLEREAASQWDSLSHVEMLFAIEEELGIRFDEAVMANLDSVFGIKDAVLQQAHAAG